MGLCKSRNREFPILIEGRFADPTQVTVQEEDESLDRPIPMQVVQWYERLVFRVLKHREMQRWFSATSDVCKWFAAHKRLVTELELQRRALTDPTFKAPPPNWGYDQRTEQWMYLPTLPQDQRHLENLMYRPPPPRLSADQEQRIISDWLQGPPTTRPVSDFKQPPLRGHHPQTWPAQKGQAKGARF